MIIGCHLSIAKGFEKTIKRAIDLKANTFQYFTRNPRGGKAKIINPLDVDSFSDLYDFYNFSPLLAHASYTMNVASDKESVREFAKRILFEDLERLNSFRQEQYYVFHPGSHVGDGIEKGIMRIVEALNTVLKEDMTTSVLLEGMSGKGTEIGSSFKELAMIIDKVDNNKKLGVCLDTCHLYSAGYDIINKLDEVIDEFDSLIGLDRLKAMHINDSKTPFNSKKDRHEKIGKGTIGIEAIANLISHKKLKDLVFVLETPNEEEGYMQEIELLRGLRGMVYE